MADPQAIVKRLSELKALRQPHEQIWLDCFDHSFPVRGSGLNSGTPYTADDIARKKAELVDDTATDAGLVLAASLAGGMTPANARWFSLQVEEADDTGEQWLDEAADTVWRAIHNSGFDAPGLECNLDIVGAGWCALYIEEDQENNALRFEQWPNGQCYIASSRPGDKVDTVFREYCIPAEQAYSEYGDALSEDSQKLAKEKPDAKIDLVRAIYPRSAWMEDAKYAKNARFASCTVEVKKRKLLRESGYFEFPVAVPRWRLIPGSTYAVGPMLDALPSARRLNAIGRLELAALEIAVSGMWIAENDGVLNPTTVRVGPRKVIAANSVESMKELRSGSDFNVSFTKSEQLRAAIRKILMADQLQPQDGPAMTATEVHARMALIRQLLGPNYGRLQSEYLQPIVFRAFGIMLRAGALTPPPESLQRKLLQVKYVSPLARAARLEDVTAMDQFETVLATQASFDQTALDVYDWDEARHERAELMGVPMKLLRTKADLENVRKDKADQQAAAQAQQMKQMAATTMIDAAGKQMANAA
jgi:hypothetical protein